MLNFTQKVCKAQTS